MLSLILAHGGGALTLWVGVFAVGIPLCLCLLAAAVHWLLRHRATTAVEQCRDDQAFVPSGVAAILVNVALARLWWSSGWSFPWGKGRNIEGDLATMVVPGVLIGSIAFLLLRGRTSDVRS